MSYLTKKKAAGRYGWHPEHFMQVVRSDPTFPQPVRWVKNGFVYFSESEIEAHQQRALDARPGNTQSPDEALNQGENGTFRSQGKHEGNSDQENAA